MSKRGKPVTKQIRKERRERAEAMIQEYNEKYPTPQAKLAALPPTGAARQRARLTALVEAQQAAKDAEKAADQAKDLVKAEKANKSDNKKVKNK